MSDLHSQDREEPFPEVKQQDLTSLIAASRRGDIEARSALITLMYPRLRRIAGNLMKTERTGHTLQPTGLANEACVRLLQGKTLEDLHDKAHFNRLAGQVMRRILVDWARAKTAEIRGGGVPTLSLDEAFAQDARGRANSNASGAWKILDLDTGLTRLEKQRPLAAQVVDAKIFGGLTDKQVATELEINLARVRREWSFALGWLRRAVGGRQTRFQDHA